MKKDPCIFLAHILESMRLIESYAEGKTWDDFQGSVSLQDMIIRRIEIMGEAVKNLPDDVRAQHPEIPWRKMAGMRDILLHQYFGVDLEAVWDAVQVDLPELRPKIRRILEELKD